MSLPTRIEVEDFLFQEADLLDNWKLDEWLAIERAYTPEGES